MHTLQERATRLSHSNVGRLAAGHGDPNLARICRVIAGDEARHEAFYTRMMAEVLDHDGCAFWIQEGEGFDYWLDNVDELEVPGYYVIEGIVGTYHRGDWWTTDDYVVWDWGPVRPATEEEIASAALADVKK